MSSRSAPAAMMRRCSSSVSASSVSAAAQFACSTAWEPMRQPWGAPVNPLGLGLPPPHSCTPTGLARATSAPGLGPRLPHGAGTGLTPATSAPGLPVGPMVRVRECFPLVATAGCFYDRGVLGVRCTGQRRASGRRSLHCQRGGGQECNQRLDRASVDQVHLRDDPGADAENLSPVPAQMWAGASPVPAQTWPG